MEKDVFIVKVEGDKVYIRIHKGWACFMGGSLLKDTSFVYYRCLLHPEGLTIEKGPIEGDIKFYLTKVGLLVPSNELDFLRERLVS